MPTPVATARQCLTEEAARALDDAVSVAKRRDHSQTTSLHAISALLSPSFSLLRESLTRRSSGNSPRLQLRALELSVGISLDRLPSSKSKANDDFAPPISNSLMAAVKRGQANQRRQPEMYHLSQIHLNNSNNNNSTLSISSIRVELKHFVLAILDDPIVNRVFGDAGFRSSDVKLGIIQPPPLPLLSRWSSSRFPPLFLCNLMDYPASLVGDENCRRISEVMMKTTEKNPILIGVCADEALSSFKESLEKNPMLIGVKLVCLEREIGDFLRREKDEEKVQGLDLKLKEATLMAESSSGVVVNLGELKVLVKEKKGNLGNSSSNHDDHHDEDDDDDSLNELVLKLSGLVENYGKKKVWLIGRAANYETYSKFLGKFPSVERNWDLQPLPITSSRSPFDGLGTKSSLMGSFVPFGGFFPTDHDFRTPLTIGKQTFKRCNACDETYKQELSFMLKDGSFFSTADKNSKNLPSWLQLSDSDLAKEGDTMAQVKDVKSASNDQILELQKKWNDHCRNLHQIPTSPSPSVPLVRPQAPKLKVPTVSVTTDLGLGMIYASNVEKLKKPLFQDEGVHLQHFPGFMSSNRQIAQSSSHCVKDDFDTSDYKTLFRKLSEAVEWQVEAISRITQIISSSNRKGNIWLSFHGPDKIAKRRVSEALADALFGSTDHLIGVNLSSQDRSDKANSLFLCRDFDVSSSRITVVDHIAQELSKKANSILFLENIDEADPLVQNSLTRAIQTGKFQDSRGREISVNNAIFIATSSTENKDPTKEFVKFSEEKILEAKNWQMQITRPRKRKASEISESSEYIKPVNKTPKKHSLDLNLPIEEEEEEIDDNSRSWVEDFFSRADGNVVFKSFDFDELADKLLTKIRAKFEEIFSEEKISIEIDNEVMVQILGAVWYAENKRAVEGWIESVIGSSLVEARERFRVSEESVVKLATCEGVLVNEWVSGIRLPKSVNLSI